MKRLWMLALLGLVACNFTYGFDPVPPTADEVPEGEQGIVTNVIDGDTVDVRVGHQTVRVRYVGINTPERDEPCYGEARRANAQLVDGKTVTLVRDISNTDRFGRLLRYIYVDGVFVEARLVEMGYAEVVSYPPDTAHFEQLRQLEDQARAANLGCHPTGIFDDGTYER